MSRELRIVFMGTPDFAVGVLDKMVASGKNIVGVITAPDRPAGRGRKLMASAVKEYAVSKNLKILQPNNLKDPSFLNALKALDANLQVVVAFRMLPQVVWQMPEFGTFNLHASLLPHYRGAAPINWVIINGEKKTGVTTFFIDEQIDTGAIIANKEIPIENRETAGSLHDKLMELGGELVVETIEMIEQDIAVPKPQPRIDNLKEAPKLTPENTRIDWTGTGTEIESFIRGLSPYPVSWTILHNGTENLKLKIYGARFQKEQIDMDVGFLLISKKEIRITCSDGYIILDEIQLPGKRKMDVPSLLNGYSLGSGARVS